MGSSGGELPFQFDGGERKDMNLETLASSSNPSPFCSPNGVILVFRPMVMPPRYNATTGRLGINFLFTSDCCPSSPYPVLSTHCESAQNATVPGMNWEIFWFYCGELGPIP